MSDDSALEAVLTAAGPAVIDELGMVERRLIELMGDRDPAIGAPAGETLAAGGKRLRPLLTLVCGADASASSAAGEASGGGAPAGRSRAAGDHDRAGARVRAAATVELVHMATLVHDDVVDRAALRRGRPTVIAAHGRGVATATGDVMFAAAFGELARSGEAEQVRVLASASVGLARGELLQREDAWSPAVTHTRYLVRCELKTGRLFAAAAELGALAGGRPELAAALASFGAGIGVAFQMLDDVLDVTAPPERTGKPRGADLLDGTVNLPFIIARERDRQLRQLDPRDIRTTDAAEDVCRRIDATGAPEAVIREALELVDRAKTSLPATLPPGQREVFGTIADHVVARSR